MSHLLAFESRLHASVSRYHSVSCDGKLPKSSISFLLLSNVWLDTSQCVSVQGSVAAQVNSGSSNVSPSLGCSIATDTSSGIGTSAAGGSSVSDFNDDATSSVLISFHDHRSKTTLSLSVNTAVFSGENKSKSKSAQEQKVCWAYGDSSHLRGGSKCSKKQEPQNHHSKAKPMSKSEDNNITETVTFNIVCSEADKVSGPLVDDGAPYSGIGVQELVELSKGIMTRWNNSIK